MDFIAALVWYAVIGLCIPGVWLPFLLFEVFGMKQAPAEGSIGQFYIFSLLGALLTWPIIIWLLVLLFRHLHWVWI